MSSTARRSLTFWIELTERCQLRCRYCYNTWRARPQHTHREMQFDMIERFAERLDRTKFDYQFVLAGGDPTAHEQLVGILALLAPHGAIEIITHGNDMPADLKQAIGRLPEASVQVSLPAVDQKLYRFLCGHRGPDEAVANLIDLRHLGVDCLMSAVIGARNIGEVEALVILAGKLGVSTLLLNRFLPSGRGQLHDDMTLSDAEWAAVRKVASTAADGAAVEVVAVGPGPKARDYRRQTPRFTVSIDGSLRFCNLVEEGFGRLDEDTDDLLARYDAFWSGGQVLNGCACSAAVQADAGVAAV